MNIICIAGNLGKDCETKTFDNGNTVTKFTVAVNEGKDKDGNKLTEWFNIEYFYTKGTPKVAEYLKKGKTVGVNGRIKTDTYTKDGEEKRFVKIVANHVELIGGAGTGAEKTNNAKDDDLPEAFR